MFKPKHDKSVSSIRVFLERLVQGLVSVIDGDDYGDARRYLR